MNVAVEIVTDEMPRIKRYKRDLADFCRHGTYRHDYCQRCQLLNLQARARNARSLMRTVTRNRNAVTRLQKQLRLAEDTLSMNEARLEMALDGH